MERLRKGVSHLPKVKRWEGEHEEENPSIITGYCRIDYRALSRHISHFTGTKKLSNCK
jgi:hypothetical protein